MEKKEGLTLIELVIVMSITATMFLVSLPRFIQLGSSTRLESEARKIAGMLRYAYALSARTARFSRVNYDLDRGYYWVTLKNKQGIFVEAEDILAKRKKLPLQIEIEDIIFPEGRINSGVTYTEISPQGFVEETIIHLREVDSNHQLSLFTNPLTGEVTIYEGYKEKK